MSLTAEETDEVCRLLDQKLSAQAIAQQLILPLAEVLAIVDARRHRAVTAVERARASGDAKLIRAADAFESARDHLHELLERYDRDAEARARIKRLEAELAAARAEVAAKAPVRPRIVSSSSSVPSADIRAWAMGTGLDVPQKGPLPRRIISAYYDAHPDLLPGEDTAS